MGRPASRVFAAAGALVTVVFLSGIGAAPVLAQPSDGDGSSQTTSDSGEKDSGSEAPKDTSTDTSTGGSTASIDPPDTDSSVSVDTDVDEPTRSGGSREPSEPDSPPSSRESGKADSGRSLTLPMLRLPAPGEIPSGQLPLPRNFYTTVEIPVPTLTQFLSALSIVPPAPPPGPSFRTQEEAPVVDAATGTAGGGGGGGAGRDPAVLHAPLVVTVPRAITAAGTGARAGARTPGAVAAEPGVTAPGVAGASTPTIRGSIAPTPGATARPMATGAGPRPESMPRSMVSPTVAQLAAVALPGLAGLILLTFGGGVVGYRQANSLRFVRTAGAERFLA
ncbi:MSCRAMM family adhesin SdrC [Mycobacterium sp. C3-094]|uniref:MSCRAMM family adhesin SdrC n=1 Tax=Mycobacterium sp. PSTR-4-N TaxID=2917745 RepID=UPI001F14BD8C|nr:MSCRAMM family adhesin SdrC [Mycobacterium sp. PSTR-4-N]MCG7596791.1 MSCRAMM family adhesin SdrC [Mycobacterium sp. PSTR-4-N]